MYKWQKSGKKLLNEVKSSNLPEDMLSLWFCGQNGFIIKYMDYCLFIDPVLADFKNENGVSQRNYPPPFSPEEAIVFDAVFCSHGHGDHAQPETLSAIPCDNIYIPAGAAGEVAGRGISTSRLTSLYAYEEIKLYDNVSLYCVPAHHPEYREDEGNACPCLGFIFKFGSTLLYFAGDSYARTKLKNDILAYGKPHIAIVPINGEDLERREKNYIGNMTELEAAKFARDIGARLVIPAHYDMMATNPGKPWLFACYMQEYAPGIPFHIFTLGEAYIYKNND